MEELIETCKLKEGKHISLEDAATKVARVYGGSAKLLKLYGITMDSTKLAASALTKGAARGAAKTLAGRCSRSPWEARLTSQRREVKSLPAPGAVGG